MRETHLQLSRLAVGYQGKALIHDIEIGVHRGEIVTLVGPNGSGKSTILKSITRQLTPVGGEILLEEGRSLHPEKRPAGSRAGASGMKRLEQFTPGELAQRMAVVLTGRLQTELMTCRDVTAMGRYPYTGRLGILSEEDERKVEEALAAVHAQHLSERPFDAVSDGERQRILLARAICQEPEIIVLDEPTSFLDIRHKLELLSILHTMSREQGITVVMSLHEIDLAIKISDRILCVRGETIFAAGRPAEILDNETVRRLYDLDPSLGYFDTRSGSLELGFMKDRGTETALREKGTCADSPGTSLTDREIRKPSGSASKADSAAAEAGSSATENSLRTEAVSVPRLMLAAPGSGSGKTLLTCGLLRLLQRKNLRPAAFKCGPDYIDPMFHRQVLGIPSRNLDTFFSPDSTQEILARALRQQEAETAVIEGVMGYFDGTGASGMQASSCDLARQTRTPVVLVVSAKGMGRSIVPLVKGFAEYDARIRKKSFAENEESVGGKGFAEAENEASLQKRSSDGTGEPLIRGVLLNRISAGMYPLMKKWIEEDTGLRVVGYVPQDAEFSWGSRHLGLLQPEEVVGLQQQIDRLADVMEKTVDLGALLEIARGAQPLRLPEAAPAGNRMADQGPAPRIAVAMDEAFSFYYEDNLELLRECGARTVFFSPLHDRELPEADGLLLGGGYPELHAQALSDNESMREQIRARAAAGMPVLAECGGFMYLQEYLETADEEHGKKLFPMCGVLPGTCRMTDHLVRFGYIEIETKTESPAGENASDGPEEGPEKTAGPGTPEKEPGTAVPGYLREGHCIRGHEFHYYDSTQNGDACTAYKPGRRRSWDCMVVRDNIMAGFPHLYYRSDPAFAAAFADRCREYRDRAHRGAG